MAGSVAAVLAACGSSGSKTVPKSQIISKGDAICRRLDATIGQPPNFNPANATTAQLKSIVPFLTKTAQVTTSEVQQVRALGTPSTDAALFKQILADGDTAAAHFRAAAQAATQGNRPAFLATFRQLQAVPSRGKQFGFHVCDTGG